MSESITRYTGGCLCGALRYEADAAPLYAGLCYCRDCQKASGAAFILFMAFAATAIRFTGKSRAFTTKADNGGEATRNFCPVCSSLVFGGERGVSGDYNIYAGTLDDLSLFRPTVAVFTRSRPAWSPIPPGLKTFDTLPPG
jgi:hypothetical protein